jgi:flagellar L-ring protein precursor FlgH
MKPLRFALAALSALSLSACLGVGGDRLAGFSAPPPPGSAAIAAAPIPAEASANTFARPQEAPGAIFRASEGYANLVTGTRARGLGDMLTIVLVEDMRTSKSTGGAIDREGGFGITPPTAGPFDFLNPNALTASGQGDFSGSGNAAQQSQLNGTVAVTIAAIYPNGTAEVLGEKQMALSQGDEWVQFAGRIRLVDIDGDNRLPSTRVANARIIYSGKGAVQQASRPGWLSRFFNAVSPF